MITTKIEVVIIGAGHAGLSVSYLLNQNNIKHILFERGCVGESWRSQRWDSFTMNTPNHMNLLPGEKIHDGLDPDRFMTKDEFIHKLDAYYKNNDLPVREYSTVISLEQTENKKFILGVQTKEEIQYWEAEQVIVASGGQNIGIIPEISKSVPSSILQIHAKDYKNDSTLPEGGVLIVGSAQSGCQIAEDLSQQSSKEVFLATSKVGRIPRKFRGKDIMFWLNRLQNYDVTTESVTDPKVFSSPQYQVSGMGGYGHTLSLQYLASKGVNILGRLNAVDQNALKFKKEAIENIEFSDTISVNVKNWISNEIDQRNWEADEFLIDENDVPNSESQIVKDEIEVLDLQRISTIIWTTGFKGDFSWIKLPVINEFGNPIHQQGVTSVPGLFFHGLPWLRKRKSGLIFGAIEDATEIANHVLAYQYAID